MNIILYLLQYIKYQQIKPVFRHAGSTCDIPEDCHCLACDAPVPYLMWNDGKKKSQVLCKVFQTRFSPTNDNRFTKTTALKCPHCSHTLSRIKDRKHFIIHKCINPKCPYYIHNLKKVDKKELNDENGKSKYKLHYIINMFYYGCCKTFHYWLPSI